ncbi:MAG: hypothetical protein C0490_03885 [Marivirga sp.]|nr:hypothetical protein [Marivirga sp.]
MIEVFKTNVKTPGHATMLVDHIHRMFDYQANFDLQDCDKILRVQNNNGSVKAYRLIRVLRGLGFHAEVLHDNLPALNDKMIKLYS